MTEFELRKIEELRRILLAILWQSIPVESSDDYQRKMMERAGASKQEIEALSDE